MGVLTATHSYLPYNIIFKLCLNQVSDGIRSSCVILEVEMSNVELSRTPNAFNTK